MLEKPFAFKKYWWNRTAAVSGQFVAVNRWRITNYFFFSIFFRLRLLKSVFFFFLLTGTSQAPEDGVARVGPVRRQRGGRQLRRVELGERGQAGPGVRVGGQRRTAGQAPRPGRLARLPQLFRGPLRWDYAALGRDVLAETAQRRPAHRGRGRRSDDPARVRAANGRHRTRTLRTTAVRFRSSPTLSNYISTRPAKRQIEEPGAITSLSPPFLFFSSFEIRVFTFSDKGNACCLRSGATTVHVRLPDQPISSKNQTFGLRCPRRFRIFAPRTMSTLRFSHKMYLHTPYVFRKPEPAVPYINIILTFCNYRNFHICSTVFDYLAIHTYLINTIYLGPNSPEKKKQINFYKQYL